MRVNGNENERGLMEAVTVKWVVGGMVESSEVERTLHRVQWKEALDPGARLS